VNSKNVAAVLGIEALLCFIIALGSAAPAGVVAGAFSFPFAQAGALLRRLSLAGAAGNMAALLIYAAVGLAPLLVLVRRAAKKKAGPEDLLLPVLSALLFYMLYVLANPALLRQRFMTVAMGGQVLGNVFYSALAGYLVLRLLRRLSRSGAAEMLGWLQLLLALIAAALVFGVFFLGVGEVRSAIAGLREANTDPGISLAATNAFIVIRFVLQQIPAVLSIRLLLLAMELAAALKREKFGRAAVMAAARLAAACKVTVAVMAVVAVAANLMQLIFSKSLLQASYELNLPFASLALTLVLLVLARYIDDSSKLSEDNRLII